MLDKFKDLKATALQRVSTVRKTDDKQKHLVALDIGTEYVKALIGRVGSEGQIEVIGVR